MVQLGLLSVGSRVGGLRMSALLPDCLAVHSGSSFTDLVGGDLMQV